MNDRNATPNAPTKLPIIEEIVPIISGSSKPPEPPIPPEEVSEKKEIVPFKNKIPCNWFITPLEGVQITAQNTLSLETFVGTIEDFNKALRG